MKKEKILKLVKHLRQQYIPNDEVRVFEEKIYIESVCDWQAILAPEIALHGDKAEIKHEWVSPKPNEKGEHPEFKVTICPLIKNIASFLGAKGIFEIIKHDENGRNKLVHLLEALKNTGEFEYMLSDVVLNTDTFNHYRNILFVFP